MEMEKASTITETTPTDLLTEEEVLDARITACGCGGCCDPCRADLALLREIAD